MTYLNKQPGGNQCQTTVLAIESVVVCIECKVVQVEEAQPMPLADACEAAHSIVLVSNPYNQNNVKGRRRIIEEFRHDCFHSWIK